ncbi:unnamed protein product [Linum trigynum]|uniref:Uncharacterized protein n=1 Tax=Linum trigynum TaxID=586398 RepID=A0AAV2CXN1_9ROSI
MFPVLGRLSNGGVAIGNWTRPGLVQQRSDLLDRVWRLMIGVGEWNRRGGKNREPSRPRLGIRLRIFFYRFTSGGGGDGFCGIVGLRRVKVIIFLRSSSPIGMVAVRGSLERDLD